MRVVIVEIGSINVDYIINSKRLPIPGETFYGDDVTIMAGGKGANQIAAAARLGAKTVFLSKVGGLDPNNSILFKDFEWAGIDTKYIETVDNVYSGSGYVMVLEDSQNCIIIIEGANKFITPEYIEKHRDIIKQANVCMTEFMIPMETCEYSMKLAKEAGITTLVNPAPSRPIGDSFYKYIDIITPNEVEAADLCGFKIETEADAARCCDYFHDKGVKYVVITLGSRGAFVSDGSKRMMIDSYKVKAVDTSGAGDSFNGGLAYALDRGYDIFESARFGNAVASRSILRTGTLRSMPTLAEVEEIYQLK